MSGACSRIGFAMAATLGLGALGVAVGCSAILGLDAKELGALDGAAGADASDDASSSDDGGGCSPSSGGYRHMTASACWSTYDISYLASGDQAFQGATFDGRYVYLVPNLGGAVARYDSQMALDEPSAWTTFDASSVNEDAIGFSGGVFDGRYLYLVPSSGAVVVRYDTTAHFQSRNAWTTFNLGPLNPKMVAFNGGVFDGKYVYLVPSDDANLDSASLVVRFDSTASFTTQSSWSTFDTTKVSPRASGFFGAVFDGRYVYLVPNDDAVADGLVTRYDTTASFATASAWSTFDIATVMSRALGFEGAVFDGRRLYFVANANESNDGIVAQYDTAGSGFTAGASWSTFDTAGLDPRAVGYLGGAFDGRYVYFVPGAQAGGILNGLVSRYDTAAETFTSKAPWSRFDTTTLKDAGPAGAYGGSVFDGRYVYLLPGTGGIVARFDARERAPLPKLYGAGGPAFYGSFF